MMKDDKRRSGMIAIIMKKLKGSADGPQVEMEEHENVQVDSSHAYDAAAESMMEAIQSNNIKKFKHSLKSFIEICAQEDECEYEAKSEEEKY